MPSGIFISMASPPSLTPSQIGFGGRARRYVHSAFSVSCAWDRGKYSVFWTWPKWTNFALQSRRWKHYKTCMFVDTMASMSVVLHQLGWYFFMLINMLSSWPLIKMNKNHWKNVWKLNSAKILETDETFFWSTSLHIVKHVSRTVARSIFFSSSTKLLKSIGNACICLRGHVWSSGF